MIKATVLLIPTTDYVKVLTEDGPLGSRAPVQWWHKPSGTWSMPIARDMCSPAGLAETLSREPWNNPKPALALAWMCKPLAAGLVRLGQVMLLPGLGTPKKWEKLKVEAVIEWAKEAERVGIGCPVVLDDEDRELSRKDW